MIELIIKKASIEAYEKLSESITCIASMEDNLHDLKMYIESNIDGSECEVTNQEVRACPGGKNACTHPEGLNVHTKTLSTRSGGRDLSPLTRPT